MVPMITIELIIRGKLHSVQFCDCAAGWYWADNYIIQLRAGKKGTK